MVTDARVEFVDSGKLTPAPPSSMVMTDVTGSLLVSVFLRLGSVIVSSAHPALKTSRAMTKKIVFVNKNIRLIFFMLCTLVVSFVYQIS